MFFHRKGIIIIDQRRGGVFLGRPYTEEERAELKEKIKQIALQMFTEQGFKNFRIQNLTKQAGISLGGFYTFYKDKEALYSEILRDEKNRIRNKILMYVEEENLTPRDFFTDLAKVFLDKTSTNKFYTGESKGLLETLVWNDDPMTAADNLGFIRQLRKIWEQKDYTVSVSDEELAAAAAAIATLCSNKEKIGTGFNSWFSLIEKLFLEHI